MTTPNICSLNHSAAGAADIPICLLCHWRKLVFMRLPSMQFIAVLNKASSVYEPDALFIDVKPWAHFARRKKRTFTDRKSRFRMWIHHLIYSNKFGKECVEKPHHSLHFTAILTIIIIKHSLDDWLSSLHELTRQSLRHHTCKASTNVKFVTTSIELNSLSK